MSSSKPVQKQLLPFQQQSVASNQQAVPLPYVAGTRLLAVIWMTPALNKVTQPTAGSGKKG